MVAWVVVEIPMVFLFEIFDITALMILKGQVLKALEAWQLQDLAVIFLKIRGYGITTAEIYWGLWLIPLALLIYKSDFIPKIFGVMLFISAIAYIVDSCTFLFFPNYRAAIVEYSLAIAGITEIAIMLWLLIKGVKGHAVNSAPRG